MHRPLIFSMAHGTIVLYQPQIPQNTGNIVRTCKATGFDLVIVRPCGFKTSNRFLKRAGLDYWEGVNVTFVDELTLSGRFFLFSSKACRLYSDVVYEKGDMLIFGSETSGLPPSLIEEHKERAVTLPMTAGTRCLNLSNAVAVGAYEMLRQTSV